LESDKASMDVPSPYSGKVVSIAVKEGDTVSEGDLIGSMEIIGDADADDDNQPKASADDTEVTETAEPEDAQSGEVEESEGESKRQEIRVPDIGGSENVPVIEVAVAEGDEISEE